MKKKQMLLGLAAALAMSAAYADEPAGFYAGGLFGSTEFEIDDLDFSEDKLTWGLHAGYQFTPNFAVEGGYYKPKSIVETAGADEARISSNALAVSIIGGIPLNEVISIHARLGAARTKSTTSITIDGDTESASDSSNELLFGFGVGATTGSTRFRFEVLRINDSDLKSTLLSASVSWFVGAR
jgi:opacity protein-like surface antigen